MLDIHHRLFMNRHLKEATYTGINLNRIDSACPGQWLYLCDDAGIVYSEKQNRFAGLDAAGVLAYRAFDAGACIEDLLALQENETAHTCDSPMHGLKAIHALARGMFPAESPREEWPTLDYFVEANIEILDIPIRLEYPSGQLEALCRDNFQNCQSVTGAKPARCHLHAKQEADGYAIYVNGRKFLTQLRGEQTGLGLLHAARSLLYEEARYDVAIHASMVADDNRGILLCAPREAGKSTLTAALVAHGFSLLTDEPALLHFDTGCVSSLRLPISLKEGSWSILRDAWPTLMNAPEHLRSDGVKLHLLHPPQTSLANSPHRLTHIVFPEYDPRSSQLIEKLSSFETLNFLNEGGILLARQAGRKQFETLLKLISTLPAHRVRYASLSEAMNALDEIRF
jgi:hypothetical protein